MAQRTQIILTDDLDGSEASRTITFAFQGASYEIDLNDEHAASIEESFAEWISNARKTTGSRARAASARTGGRELDGQAGRPR